MKMLNVLTTQLGQDEDATRGLIRATFLNEKCPADDVNCIIRSTWETFFSYVGSNPIDVIIMAQHIGSHSVSVEECDQLMKKLCGNEVLIYVVDDNNAGTQYMKGLINCGLYNAVFSKDSACSSILDRYLHPYRYSQASYYYGLDQTNTTTVEEAFNPRSTAEYLNSFDGTYDNMMKRMQYLQNSLKPEQIIDVLAIADESAVEMVGRNINYRYLVDAANERRAKKKSGKPAETKKQEKPLSVIDKVMKGGPFGGSGKKNDAAEAEVYEENAERTLAFVSTRLGAGCTYLSIACAETLARRGYKVAVVEFDDAGRSFESLCALVKGTNDTDGYCQFEFGGVDYYYDIYHTAFENEYKQKYDYVIYDFGCVAKGVLEAVAKSCHRVFVVASATEHRNEEVNAYIRSVKDIDEAERFNYLFTLTDKNSLGNIISANPGIRCDAVEYIDNPYNPSGSVKKQFARLVENGCGEMKNPPKRKLINSRLKDGGKVSFTALSAAFAVLAAVLAIAFFLVYTTDRKAIAERDERIKQNEAGFASVLQERQDSIDGLNEQIESLERIVCFVKEAVPIGTLITEDMIEEKKILTELPQSTFAVYGEIVGRYSAANLEPEVPLTHYFSAVYVDMPLTDDVVDDLEAAQSVVEQPETETEGEALETEEVEGE